jgi:enoyl-CoA hydratase/carnithine racemase
VTDGLVELRIEDSVATVTLARPEAGNRVTRAMMLDLRDAIGEAARADIVVLQGRGADFTLGRDQSERPAGVSRAESLGLILDVNRALGELGGVTVALVRGRALGFGSGLALHCDLVLAADTAVFGFDELAHGFPPLVVQSYLTRYIPRKQAADLILTGRAVPALEARALGMVSRVVGDAELEPAGAALVKRLAGTDARALRRAKRFFAEIDEVPLADRPRHGLDELVAWFDARVEAVR